MLSVKVTNALCNMQCTYCYEHIYRSKINQRAFDLEAIKRQIGNENDAPYLHGGEALLAPIQVLEELFAISYQKTGYSSIQTNGTLITDKHIELFKKYNTQVGISIDGPGDLGKYRRTIDGQPTADMVMDNIRWLRKEGVHVGIICVLTKANALPEQRERFKDWVRELKALGVTGRMNPAEIDYPSLQKIALTPEELEDFYRDMTRFVLTEIGGDWLPYRDAVDSLLGLNQGTCVFGECDYYYASAERVILSDGTTASCMKTAKTGHVYPRYQNAGQRGFAKIRYEVLPKIEQESGGCQGCRYWRNCTGGCPAEGIDGDWRNKTRFCKAYCALFEETEQILRCVLPNITLTTDLPDEYFPEANSVRGMAVPSFRYMIGGAEGSVRPSSWRKDAKQLNVPQDPPTCRSREDYQSARIPGDHGDRPHGDRPHGDHGDLNL